ncbi:MAG: YceI family protein [Flaviaesturariibacter sp.]|nr:YceI family protein [Flaviaesturariibacter sp.]
MAHQTIRPVLMAALLSASCLTATAQRYFTKSGHIDFSSKAALENIRAVNKSVTCVLDTKTGAVQFSVLMKGFSFEKALMQEHFNENYVESDKFPKAEFRGTITNNGEIDYSKPGSYTVNVKGLLTIHGVTKPVETSGTIQVGDGAIQASASFQVLVSDYRISIPAVVRDNVSNTIRIQVSTRLEPLSK